MEWTKLPTNLITSDLSDAEILSIVKYQLIFSLIENEPSDKILNKFLTKKQKNIAKNFVADIKTRVENDIKKTKKKREKNAEYYSKNKDFEELEKENSSDLNDDFKRTQIRLDKIRLDKIKEKEKKEKENFNSKIKKCFDLFWSECPNKVDEFKSYSLFYSILNSGEVTFDEIFNGIKNYKNFVESEGIEQRYTSSPFNWLMNRKWKDEYVLSKPKSILERIEEIKDG